MNVFSSSDCSISRHDHNEAQKVSKDSNFLEWLSVLNAKDEEI